MQLAQRGDRRPVAGHVGLRDFDVEQLGRQPALGESTLDVRDDRRMCELPTGDVDRQPQPLGLRPRGLPDLHLPARIAQDPIAERNDRARRLRHRHEIVGTEQPMFGVLPANQSLDTARKAILGVDDRLVMEPQFAGGDRLTQLGIGLRPGQRAFVRSSSNSS